MALYPFWANVKSNSRKDEIGVGARGKVDGELTTTILQRENGAKKVAYVIRQVTEYSTEEDKWYCVTRVYHDNKIIHKTETEY